MIRCIIPLSLALLLGCAESSPSVSVASPIAGESVKQPKQRTVVSLTEDAAKKVSELQQQGGTRYLRVGVKGGGKTGFTYDLRFDDKVSAEDDYLGESGGIEIVVDLRSSILLEGATIDWTVDESGNEGFKFDNSNAYRNEP